MLISKNQLRCLYEITEKIPGQKLSSQIKEIEVKYSVMNLCFKGFVESFIFSYSLITAVVTLDVFTREMCLDQALTIHAMLKQEQCPYHQLNTFSGSEGCSVVCEGNFTSKNILYDETHCVGFNINFHLNDNISTKLRDFPCDIAKCILEVIDFECSFPRNVSYTDFNETFSFGDKTDEEEKSTAPAISVVLSCAFVGSLLGMGGLIVVQRCRKFKQRLDPTAVSYQPNNGTNGEDVTITHPMEDEYADVEESIMMIAKFVQRPSYKEVSSSESSSREIIYHI
uniref:Uncharacterized protein LOC111105953 n=1 Tax=Crassostrea virginica TaxID=6565 RepID=A0A8B8AYE7_CRAVI|nr:uncharacterized protein LOC111105953 [Crassostrea virginica]